MYSGPDTAYTGHEICFNYNEDTLTIVDVTDKDHMKMLSRTGYLGAKYTHQVGMVEDSGRTVVWWWWWWWCGVIWCSRNNNRLRDYVRVYIIFVSLPLIS